MSKVPLYKIVATAGGVALTGSAVWMNAAHVAHAEGSFSPLVLASIIVTACAAIAPPLAERAGQNGEWLKAVMIWTFFAATVAFSLTTSISRSSEYAGGKAASVEQANEAGELAKEAYEALKASVKDECVKRGPKCRELEGELEDARKALVAAAPVRAVDPGAERLATVLGIDRASVQLYAPLLLPLSLEFGGFILLALGLAPRRRREEEALAPAIAPEPAVIATEEPASAMQTIAKAAAKPPAAGTKAYYLQRLQREFPDLAMKVAAGELSVYAASIEAGLRKAPVKRKWNANQYLKAPVDA